MLTKTNERIIIKGVRRLAMKRMSSKKKKPISRKIGSWLKILAEILAGTGAFLTGLAQILEIILKSG